MNTTTEMALWLACGGAVGMFLGIAILVGAVFILVNLDGRRRDRHEARAHYDSESKRWIIDE